MFAPVRRYPPSGARQNHQHMKKALLKKFETLAATLPAMQHTGTAGAYRQYTGTAGKTELGRALATYTRTGVPVNHVNRMKKAYAEGGWAAVNRYAAQVQAIHNKQQQPAPPPSAASPNPEGL